MDKTNLPVITISRQYYAGGRSVARKLAEALDIPWYDYDLAKLTASISGYQEDVVMNEGEEISRIESALENLVHGVSFTSSHDEIFSAQRAAVIELSAKPCIIVGRCANAILREEGIKAFDVFLYADIDTRVNRTMENRDIPHDKALKFLKKHDSFRKKYYDRYTGRTYGDYKDYTMMLDTGAIDYETCARIILAALG